MGLVCVGAVSDTVGDTGHGGQGHAQHGQEQAVDEQIRSGQFEAPPTTNDPTHQEQALTTHSQNRPGHAAASSRPQAPASRRVHRCRAACAAPATRPASMPSTGGRSLDQPVDHPQHRRLAAAGGAEQNGDIPTPDLKREIANRDRPVWVDL
jgi:hypothetical protein